MSNNGEYDRGYSEGKAFGFKHGIYIGWLKAITSNVALILSGAVSFILLAAVLKAI